MKKVVGFLSAAVAVFMCSAANASDRPFLAIGFDEGTGSWSDDKVSGFSARLSPSAKWATGNFGSALAAGEAGACATLDAGSGLEGASACTVFLRFRKNGKGHGAYPSLLSSDDWGRGGMIFFSNGKSLALRLRAGAKGPESSWPVFAEIPEGKWHSVAFVFDRPSVTVYADGKKVASGKWDHPLRGRTFRIGGWYQSSFGGFIDDVRIWKKPLDAKALSALAADSAYDEIEGYQDDGTGGIKKTELVGQGGTPLVKMENDDVHLVFDSIGQVSSLREKNSRRELVSNAVSFVSVKLADGRVLDARRLEKRGSGNLAWIFPGKTGEVVMSVKPFGGGWSFKVESCTVKDVSVFEFCRLTPVCDRWIGRFANVWSDEKSAVAVRSYDLYGEPLAAKVLRVSVSGEYSPLGRRAAVTAGSRSSMRERLKAMTIDAGVPRSDAGGAWAMDSEVARWSYVFAPIVKGDIDYWIEFVKRGGFSLIHLNSSWTDCLGHCPISRRAFPGGIDEMKACAAKAHAAGLRVGMHTLTACINPYDPWISPVCREDLVADATYTLAAPLAEDATELLVNEKPISKHSTVFTYSSNGNAIRIGGELVQYTGIRREKPYAFTGLKRGAFRTKKGGVYPKGTKADYLHQRYIAFYPKPDSKLADELADRLAEVYNTCNLDEFYFDGSEGMGTRYGIDAMRHKIYSRLKPNNGHSPSIEASCGGANNWWFQTRMATTDHGVYGVKRFHDWHIDWAINLGRNANFLEPQMGWWQPRTDVPRARGHMLDEMEYFASKNAGHDAPMSIQGVAARPLPIGVRRQMTVLGWYEYPRLARAFTPEVKEYLAASGSEARLRQDEDGCWNLTEVECHVHRAALPWLREWTVESADTRKAALRVEALYNAGKGGTPVLKAADFPKMTKRAASGVEATLEQVADAEHGPAFRLTARNLKASAKNAAWASARRAFPFPGADLGKNSLAFGVWIKGDGSGALLNLQFTTPPEFHYCFSDHYVRLDFKGWRYVTVLARERDADKHHLYKWPYGGYAPVYRTFFNPQHVASVSAYLNDVPAGAAASVEIGEINAFDMVPGSVDSAEITVNGTSFKVPFALASGEYAELDCGAWTHYSALGQALRRVKAPDMPELSAGGNKLAFKGGEGDRVEVTLFALGRSRSAFNDELTDSQRGIMRYEGVMPFEYAPSKGLLPPEEIAVRPGEKASLSIELYGPAANPVLEFAGFLGFGGSKHEFMAEIAQDERLVCRDGLNWQVEKCKSGEVVGQGKLSKPLPVLDSSRGIEFSAEVPEGKSCSVDLLKTYIREEQANQE